MTIEEGANWLPEENEATQAFRAAKLAKLNGPSLRIPNKIVSVPVYEQANGYYCAPATVKQVTQFISGSSKTQAQIASDLGTTTSGTDMTRIPDVLNGYIGSTHYFYDSMGSTSDWFGKIIYSVNQEMPAILDINTRAVDEIPYNSDGHFVNISGYNQDTQMIRITDPWKEGLGHRWYSRVGLYNANNNHFRKAIIW